MENEIFTNLFVLEAANNHWGCLERGKRIVSEFAKVVLDNGVKAAIKLQFRDVDTFIHEDFKDQGDGHGLLSLPKRTRYIQKTFRTKLGVNDFKELIEYIRSFNIIPMATPFDEKSVDLCEKFDLPIIKVASSDLNDWSLLARIAKTKRPVILSSGGASEEQIDNAVKFLSSKDIVFALNHCVSKYPSEDNELELNQIDYLKQRYPGIEIGLSTHEYTDWHSSMFISYAKGARLWERHIDLPYPAGHEQAEVSSYCSLPHQIDEWFKAFKKAQVMCGSLDNKRRNIDDAESKYLQALYRGLYFKRKMLKGCKIKIEDLYSAIPYQKESGHISIRDFVDNKFILNKDVEMDSPLTKNDILTYISGISA